MISETSDIKEAILSNFIYKKGQVVLNSHLNSLKNEAIEALSSLEFPTSKHEEWKYTDLTRPLKKNFDFNQHSGLINYSKEDIEPLKFPGLDACYLVFINGRFNRGLSDSSMADQNILIEDIGAAFDQNNSVIVEHFSKHADFTKDFFTALSTAYSDKGLFLRVLDGNILERPLVFLFISDSTTGNTFSQPRNLIYIGKNSKATFIENYISKGTNPQLTNGVSEIIVGENSIVDYYKLQNESEHSYHVGTTQVYQSRSSTFTSTTITTNGGMVRNNLNIKLDGEGSEANMFGLYLLDNKTHVDNHTAVDHAKPHALSNELYKGIMDGRSTGVFNGKIYVRKDAQKTNAFQSNRNVLLSGEASINTKPQLEIWADDVKCSHGATTGQIDEEALFYLQSRGISKETAKAMMMLAFASEVVNLIKEKEVKAFVQATIENILNK